MTLYDRLVLAIMLGNNDQSGYDRESAMAAIDSLQDERTLVELLREVQL